MHKKEKLGRSKLSNEEYISDAPSTWTFGAGTAKIGSFDRQIMQNLPRIFFSFRQVRGLNKL
jgi:hypothetical protein